MEEVKEAEANEEDEKREETPLEIASKDVMTVLRESRENIQSVLPYVLERLEVRRLQETLKHEIEEATYIAIRNVLQNSLNDTLVEVLKEKIREAVSDAFENVVKYHLREPNLKDYIESEVKRRLDSFISDQVYEIRRELREEVIETLKDRVKEQILEEIDDEVVRKLKEQALSQIEAEEPLLTQTLKELSRRVDWLWEENDRLRQRIIDLRNELRSSGR